MFPQPVALLLKPKGYVSSTECCLGYAYSRTIYNIWLRNNSTMIFPDIKHSLRPKLIDSTLTKPSQLIWDRGMYSYRVPFTGFQKHKNMKKKSYELLNSTQNSLTKIPLTIFV
jgi:hypothetical protein